MASVEPARRKVAFLRGINVGGHRVKMDHLRDVLSTPALGLESVATFIASGNVVFDSDVQDIASLEASIADHLAHQLGYEVETFVRTPAELAEVIRFGREAGAEPERAVHVAFTHARVSAEARRTLESLQTGGDGFAFQGREVYWLRQSRPQDSRLAVADVGKVLASTPHTIRNLNTVERIQARFWG